MAYLSIARHGEFEYIDRRSRFIGIATPVTDEAAAVAFIRTVKSAHPQANHHVYAYMLRAENTARYSDDREPQSSAGIPVLDCMRKRGITDCAIVVVRYFGGVLLGTGGLVRAYGSAAAGALDAAQTVRFDLYRHISASVSYADYQKLLPLLSSDGVYRENEEYSNDVKVTFSVCSQSADEFCRQLTDICSGRISFAQIKEIYESKKI